jgi:hypothetical protein
VEYPSTLQNNLPSVIYCDKYTKQIPVDVDKTYPDGLTSIWEKQDGKENLDLDFHALELVGKGDVHLWLLAKFRIAHCPEVQA